MICDDDDTITSLLLQSHYQISCWPDTFADLPATCEHCGLPFDRSGRTKVYPAELRAWMAATGHPAPPDETHCPRFVGRDECWDCEGARLQSSGASDL